MSSYATGKHPPTRAYVARRSKDGLPKPETIRCLKRYAARETYRFLEPASSPAPRGAA